MPATPPPITKVDDSFSQSTSSSSTTISSIGLPPEELLRDMALSAVQTVTNGVNDIVISKSGTDVLSASVSSPTAAQEDQNTVLELTNMEVDAGKVSKIELTGDFSDFEFGDIMDILMELPG